MVIKIKLTIEFCPNEPKTKESVSELDDIRQHINQNN